MRDLLSFRLALPLLAFFAGCGEAPPAKTAPAVAVAKKKAEEPAAQPSDVAPIEYSYNPVGKRDPFRAPTLDRLGSPEGPESEVVCAEPLCQFDLDELTVVAVVSGDANPLAMVEDKNHVGYLVRRNSKIGRHGGKVTQILRDCVVVTSFITGPDGKAQPNKVNMCIQPDARSAPVLDLFEGKLRQ